MFMQLFFSKVHPACHNIADSIKPGQKTLKRLISMLPNAQKLYKKSSQVQLCQSPFVLVYNIKIVFYGRLVAQCQVTQIYVFLVLFGPRRDKTCLRVSEKVITKPACSTTETT